MSFLHKVLATEQLAYDATLVALRHHFGDRRARWRHWTLHDFASMVPIEPPETHDRPVIDVLNYAFQGLIDVPRLKNLIRPAQVNSCIRVMRDGSRVAFSVDCNYFGGVMDEKLRYMSYNLGLYRPKWRSKDALPKFLRTKLILPRPLT